MTPRFQRMTRRGFPATLGAAALSAAAALLFSGASAQPDPEPLLRELESVEGLRTAFDCDHGRVRLVLLLSPT